MDVFIHDSKRYKNGEVSVFFGNENAKDWYYAHGIREIGNPEDSARLYTMWAWINHMRHKRWWNPELEEEFIKEVTQYFV